MNDLRRERLQHEGLLGEKEREAKSLRLRCEALRDSARSHLDPLEKIEELNIELTFQAVTDLWNAYLQLLELLGEIKNIKKALGKADS